MFVRQRLSTSVIKIHYCFDRTGHGSPTEPDQQSSTGRIGGVDRATPAQLRAPAHTQLPADPVLQLDAKHTDRHGQLQSHQFPAVQGRRIGGSVRFN